jgi:undecaprenyl diphosphate synthase
MVQSTSSTASESGLHVAIIMDGNGRWARARGRPRTVGHAAGVDALQRVAEAAPAQGISTLTVYAFSADNWTRPRTEVAALLTLFRRSLASEVERCLANGVRLSIVGRRDRLPPSLVRAIDDAERATAGGHRLWLRVAIDYSARDAICLAAARWAHDRPPTRAELAGLLESRPEVGTHSGTHSRAVPDVDLLIRTGGEQRLSDFLLWECAYAELYFTPRRWPDFDAGDLGRAVREYRRRERRFGGLPQAAAG